MYFVGLCCLMGVGAFLDLVVICGLIFDWLRWGGLSCFWLDTM